MPLNGSANEMKLTMQQTDIRCSQTLLLMLIARYFNHAFNLFFTMSETMPLRVYKIMH